MRALILRDGVEAQNCHDARHARSYLRRYFGHYLILVKLFHTVNEIFFTSVAVMGVIFLLLLVKGLLQEAD